MHPGPHIFLTGFMGSGKSLLGKKIAAFFNHPFIDLDAYIEKHEGKTIGLLFEQEGEAAFRKAEAICLQAVAASASPAIIALGGGTVCFGTNLQVAKQAGLLVYIELSAGALLDRLKNSRQPRPLLKNLTEAEMLEKIKTLLEQRKPFYGQAHLVVNGLNLTPQLLHQKIREALPEHTD